MKTPLGPLLLAPLALTASVQAQGATVVVDLDALSNSPANPVPVSLAAGCWQAKPVAGVFTAFNAWGKVSGCEPDGTQCVKGWLTSFFLSKPGGGVFGGGGPASHYDSAALALAESTQLVFTLPQAATVTLAVSDCDNCLTDNLGGISVELSLLHPPFPSSEIVRLGTPPNPNALLPGQSSAPIVGAIWDPRIDHSSFASDSILDVLAVAASAADSPSPIGTFLCDPSTLLLLETAAAGSAFAVEIPADCVLIGVSVCSQGVSVDPAGVLALTNALDVTIGTS